MTIKKGDVIGDLTANIDGKYSCKTDLAVNGVGSNLAKACTLSPQNLNGKAGSEVVYHITCVDQTGKLVDCPHQNRLGFSSSNENVATFSSYNKDTVNVLVKGTGNIQFTVFTTTYPNQFFCSANLAGTGGNISEITSCTLHKPPTIDLNKQFSVPIDCFDASGKLIACKNVGWGVTEFAADEFKFGTLNDKEAFLTITKSDAVGELNANANGKAFCKTDLFVNGVGSNLATSCTLSPASLSGKTGDTLKYKIACKDKTGKGVECPHEGRLAFSSSNENVATFSSYDKEETGVFVKAPGNAQFTVITTTYPNKFSCKSNVVGTGLPINGTNGTTTADLVLKPPILFVQVGKRGLYELDCFINNTLSSCPSPPELELEFSTPNADLDTYKKDYFGPGKSAISVNGITEGSSLIIAKWPKFNIIKTAKIEVFDNITGGNQTGNGTTVCDLDPSSINIGLNKIGPVTLTCLNNTKPISCPLISVEFSNNNANLQSYKKNVFGLGKDELVVKTNSLGNSLMTVKSDEFTNACATIIVIGPGNQTNVTSNITNSGTGCVLSLPSVIEEDKQFSVGLSCFNDSSGSKKGVGCNNVEWSINGLGPNDYTLHSTSDGDAVLTLTKEDVVGTITANVDNKYSCATDIFVTKNLCTVSPSIWIAKPGDERTFAVKCKFEDTVEECNVVQWNINQLGPGFTKKSDSTNQSKQTISAPKDANTFVDGKNIVVTAEGIDSGKEYLCTVKTYIASLICQDLV
ncbi:hypothetical protein HYT84_02960 [Candidatus Micrarchaeota archaeon]|nr:hypothetical protein [Candidatus Micrarchaeota archaeon]